MQQENNVKEHYATNAKADNVLTGRSWQLSHRRNRFGGAICAYGQAYAHHLLARCQPMYRLMT